MDAAERGPSPPPTADSARPGSGSSGSGSSGPSPRSEVLRSSRKVFGPRRTVSTASALSHRPSSGSTGSLSTGSEDDASRKLQDVAGDWHIAWSKLKKEEELGKGSFKGGTLKRRFADAGHGEVVFKGKYLETPVAIGEVMGIEKTDFVALENELRILQHIRHPNALLFIGVSFGSEGDKFYIVTEFAPLGDLHHLLKKVGPQLSWKCKIKMAQEISHALAYLHDRGVFHRDLKCENVLVFPGNNDGYLLKLADFGLSFLNDHALAEKEVIPIVRRIPGLDWGTSLLLPLVPTQPIPHIDLASSQVGTIWIRAPEVDSAETYSAAAVDVFSFGMVLVDLLTDGNGEDIRWEVTYQKKDPVTGKSVLQFGVDTKKLHSILSKVKMRLPPDLVKLAVQCCDEVPEQRPTLADINAALAVLVERYTGSETVRETVRKRLERQESRALTASAAIRSELGTTAWATATRGLVADEVAASEAWDACVTLFESCGSPLLEEESAVIAECVGAHLEGQMDVQHFAELWHKVEPVLRLVEDVELGWLWRKGHVALFVDRATAVSLLNARDAQCIVLRVSSTPGKVTVSVIKEHKVIHQQVSLDVDRLILGSGKDAKMFASLSELFVYLQSLGYTKLVCRDCVSNLALAEVIAGLPKRESLKTSDHAGYDVMGL